MILELANPSAAPPAFRSLTLTRTEGEPPGWVVGGEGGSHSHLSFFVEHKHNHNTRMGNLYYRPSGAKHRIFFMNRTELVLQPTFTALPSQARLLPLRSWFRIFVLRHLQQSSALVCLPSGVQQLSSKNFLHKCTQHPYILRRPKDFRRRTKPCTAAEVTDRTRQIKIFSPAWSSP